MHSLRVLAIAATVLSACGAPPNTGPSKPKEETPEEEVLRVARHWQSEQQERGFLPAPSAVETFERSIGSRLKLTRGGTTAEERIVVKEKLMLRDGTRLSCEASGGAHTNLRYGRHKGQAALELSRPPVVLTRNCNGTPPEVAIEMPGGPARLELRSDQLYTYEPIGDERVYIPADPAEK
jgi:hypothetical protein